jgi:hypothetical protein
MKKIAIVAAMLFQLSVFAQSDIKINIEKGFTMHSVHDVKLNMDMMGNKMDMKTLNYITGTVENVNSKNETEWIFVIDSMIIDSKQGDEKSFVNTNDAATMKDAPEELIEGMGKKIKATVDAYGRVTVAEEGTAAMIVKACFIEYAGQAISAKQNWKIENELSMMGKNINVATTYIIKSQDETNYIVEAKASIAMMGKTPAVSIYTINKKTGMIVNAITTLEMNMMGTLSTTTKYNATW